MSDKIREEFEKWRLNKYGKSIGGTYYDYLSMRNSYEAGHKSRDPEVKGWETLADIHNEEIFNLTSRVAVAEDANEELKAEIASKTLMIVNHVELPSGKYILEIGKDGSILRNTNIIDLKTENKKLVNTLENVNYLISGNAENPLVNCVQIAHKMIFKTLTGKDSE